MTAEPTVADDGVERFKGRSVPSLLKAASLRVLRRVVARPREAPPSERSVRALGRHGLSKEAGEGGRGLLRCAGGLQGAELQEALEQPDVWAGARRRRVEARLDP
eukprot:3449616-Alexandrium_andersonii.AAC.1